MFQGQFEKSTKIWESVLCEQYFSITIEMQSPEMVEASATANTGDH